MNQEQTILAWRSALWAAALNALGTPLELFIGRNVPGLPSWPMLVSAAVGVVLFGWLWVRRKRPTRGGAAGAFLLNTAVLVAMLWMENDSWALLGAQWLPFQANKLGAFIVGLLAPELWVGVVSIAAYGLSAVAQWLLFAPQVREHVAVGEPVITLVFALFAIVLLVQASQRYALQRRLVEHSHRVESLDRLARALLAVRDLANTPVQTIELTLAALSVKHPDATASLERAERALRVLHRLNQALAEYEPDVDWHVGDESFDPLEVLRRDSLA